MRSDDDVRGASWNKNWWSWWWLRVWKFCSLESLSNITINSPPSRSFLSLSPSSLLLSLPHLFAHIISHTISTSPYYFVTFWTEWCTSSLSQCESCRTSIYRARSSGITHFLSYTFWEDEDDQNGTVDTFDLPLCFITSWSKRSLRFIQQLLSNQNIIL